jgi:surface antigen
METSMMPNLQHLITVLLCGVACFAQGVQASNLGVFEDAPYTYFNEKDRRIFHNALDKALNSAPDNELSAWSNPSSGSRGEITPLDHFERAGKNCRQVKIFNEARGRRNQSVQVFCRQADGVWKWEVVPQK